MNVFLLGVTGGTGYETLKRLIRDSHYVRILVGQILRTLL